MQETWVQSLGWEDPLEKGTAIHSSIVAWRIPRILPRGRTELDTLSDFRFTSLTCKCGCCGTSRTVSSFPHHSETCCGGDGSCRRDEAGHLCPWARTQARAIRGFTSSHPGQRLNPLAYRQAGVGRASPGASSGRFSPRKFSSF